MEGSNLAQVARLGDVADGAKASLGGDDVFSL